MVINEYSVKSSSDSANNYIRSANKLPGFCRAWRIVTGGRSGISYGDANGFFPKGGYRREDRDLPSDAGAEEAQQMDKPDIAAVVEDADAEAITKMAFQVKKGGRRQ